jgi:hypothetical protein
MRARGGGGGGAEIAVAALRRHAAPAPLPALPAASGSGAPGTPAAALGAPPPRTNRTRRVPHPVLIGHAASFTPPAEGDAAAGEAGADGGPGFSLAAMRLLAREAEARAEALNEQGHEAMRAGRWRPGPIDSDAAGGTAAAPEGVVSLYIHIYILSIRIYYLYVYIIAICVLSRLRRSSWCCSASCRS